ncbi:hypothetical protein JGY85_04250 [Shigella sonnei]|nr:hypothetical protein [Shigella sonnei]
MTLRAIATLYSGFATLLALAEEKGSRETASNRGVKPRQNAVMGVELYTYRQPNTILLNLRKARRGLTSAGDDLFSAWRTRIGPRWPESASQPANKAT